MRVLCISTYELGQQPLSLAGLAARLGAAGHEAVAVDLSVEAFPAEEAEAAEAVVFSVPMHTATELSVQAARRIIEEHGRRPFGFVGLYAPVLQGNEVVAPGDLLVAGEAGEALDRWLKEIETGQPSGRPDLQVAIGPPRPVAGPLPARRALPGLVAYARYLEGGESRLVAAIEASRGCNHTCTHCPVAPIYKGRSRPVALEAVVADIDQAVSLGAGHVTFSDPDFLNRPRHAMAVAAALSARHPGTSFDATIKVEHLLRHHELLEPLARHGLKFVTSAFESTDDEVLTILRKGHSAADEARAVALCRRAGIEIRPSWLPFSPWTTLSSLADLLIFSARADLASSTDPVQYSIRLLLPAGSLLLAEPDPVLSAALGERTGPGGSRPWRHRDGRIDELQGAIAAIAEAHEQKGAAEAFAAIWQEAAAAGVPLPAEPPAPLEELSSGLAAGERPRLSEAWFCCAEPTAVQMEAVAG